MIWWLLGFYFLIILAFVPLWTKVWNMLDPPLYEDDYMIDDRDPDEGDRS